MYIICVKNLAANWKEWDWLIDFDISFVTFFKYRFNVSFFRVIWKNIPHFKHFLKIVRRDSAIASSTIFNIQILIKSWPLALLGSSLWMILLKLSFVNSIFHRHWLIMGLVQEERTLLFSISSFATIWVWLLTCYFYFSNEADKLFFSLIIILTLTYIKGGSWLLKILVSWAIKLPWWY